MIYFISENKNIEKLSLSLLEINLEKLKPLREITNSKCFPEINLYVYGEDLVCNDLIKIQRILLSLNLRVSCIYSNSRQTIISAKNLKLKAYFDLKTNEPNFKNLENQRKDNITHFGMVRSGEKLYANGNLIIIGDVNPGAQISAKKNIYVWGKLCGVAFAGKNGTSSSTIASLYLNPLQLRIGSTIAIGPNEKPSNNYPEIASVEGDKIVIRPLLINK